MENNHPDELDRIIDGALAGYSDAEPLAGLEERVLNRVRLAKEGRRRSVRWWWALAIPALAGLAVVVGLWRSPHNAGGPAGEIAKSVAPPQVTAPPPLKAATAPAITAPPVRRAARPRPARPKMAGVRQLPKRSIFPTPTPPTPEERALVMLALLHPDEVQSLTEIQKLSSEPIEIPPIQIAPLRIDGN